MLGLCNRLYIALYCKYIFKICPKEDILYICTTQIHNEEKKNVQSQLTKRGLNQTNERPTRHDHTPIPQRRTNARLPNHHKNPQKLRCLLRTQHHLPTPMQPRKERLRKQHLEHEIRTPTQNLQPNARRTKHAKLHRRIPKLHLQKNNHRQLGNRTNSRHHRPQKHKSPHNLIPLNSGKFSLPLARAN
jgi:hypothetical protein